MLALGNSPSVPRVCVNEPPVSDGNVAKTAQPCLGRTVDPRPIQAHSLCQRFFWLRHCVWEWNANCWLGSRVAGVHRARSSERQRDSKQIPRHNLADDRIVIALSDANLGPYGILPSMISEALTSQADVVQAYAVFIGEPPAAHWLVQQLPVGRAFACTDTAQLPNIIRSIFVHATSSSQQ